MLTPLQEKIDPLFFEPTDGWLNRLGYERRIAALTGGRLAVGREQHFFDVSYDHLGMVEYSVTKTGRPWIDGLRVAAAVRAGLGGSLYYAFIRYDKEWVQAVSLVPLLDLHRMLALSSIEDGLLEHAATVKRNARRGRGWPRGHIGFHLTVVERDVIALARQRGGFSGPIKLQTRLAYYERALSRVGAPCSVLDPSTGNWQAAPTVAA